MKTDFFDYICSRVFFQLSKDRLSYLVILFSKNLNLIEYNYEIYDKKLLAIIQYFK